MIRTVVLQFSSSKDKSKQSFEVDWTKIEPWSKYDQGQYIHEKSNISRLDQKATKASDVGDDGPELSLSGKRVDKKLKIFCWTREVPW